MRDDLSSLPLPAAAKRYSRGRGMRFLRAKPQNYINMVAAVTGQQKRKRGFRNKDAGQKVRLSVKEAAKVLAAVVLDSELDIFGVIDAEHRKTHARFVDLDTGEVIVVPVDEDPMPHLKQDHRYRATKVVLPAGIPPATSGSEDRRSGN